MSISFMTSASMLNMSYQSSSSQTSIVNNGSIGNLSVGGGGSNFMSTFGALDQAASGGSFASAYAGPNGAFAMAGSNGGSAMAAAGPNGAFASANGQNAGQCNKQMDPMKMMGAMAGLIQMMAQMMGLGQQQPQQNDPMAGNKQMGQNMEQMGKRMQQIGGDLKDDGKLNHSNQKPNPQKMMMAMMGMFMQAMMQTLMGGMGQQQNQTNSPFQMLT